MRSPTLRFALLAASVAAAPVAAGAPKAQALRVNPANRYHLYRYQVRWRGGMEPIAGFEKLATAASTPAPAPERGGGGRVKYEVVTLERGVTAAPDFAAWLNAKNSNALESLTVDLADEAGRIVSTRTHAKCHAVEIQALPDLDAGANATRIPHLVLRCTP